MTEYQRKAMHGGRISLGSGFVVEVAIMVGNAGLSSWCESCRWDSSHRMENTSASTLPSLPLVRGMALPTFRVVHSPQLALPGNVLRGAPRSVSPRQFHAQSS